MDNTKKQKMEELRKKLLQMDQDTFKELLDTSDDKPQWQIDRNEKLRYALKGNSNKTGKKAPHTEEAKLKIKENNAKYWEGKKRPEVADTIKSGREHRAYGKGRKYIEHTTGFTGTQYDMNKQFDMTTGTIEYHVKRGGPVKRGKLKGLHFEIVAS